jgi:hypothetical protein
MDPTYDLANPNPCALIESLRSVGYTLPTAIADIVDNSISAEATEIHINFHWSGKHSWISILDNGEGMDEETLKDAMRPGTKNPIEVREPNDLGRFGLGLKTASFSQCRMLSVWSKELLSPVFSRKWDLDYVAKKNEWRLIKDFSHNHDSSVQALQRLKSGTLVIWENLDRIIDESPAEQEEAHQRFLNILEAVRNYLSMIFHRHLSGNTNLRHEPLNIYINGDTEQHKLSPWDPFVISQTVSSIESPVESISCGGNNTVKVKGYVLPHKDRISDEEFVKGGGQRGWIGQEGFYIYRNDRILVAGDWLRLGRGRPWPKEEQYKLARISIDIPNSLDLEWSLDVKKSTAKPPAYLRARLTGLAEKIRSDAKKVFTHRGEYGTRATNSETIIERPWTSKERNGHLVYKINRNHPLVKYVIDRLGPMESELNVLLRLIEETVPVQKIWLDSAESDIDHAIPYEGLDENVILSDLRKTKELISKTTKDPKNVRAYLSATEPFNRYPELIEKIFKEQ